MGIVETEEIKRNVILYLWEEIRGLLKGIPVSSPEDVVSLIEKGGELGKRVRSSLSEDFVEDSTSFFRDPEAFAAYVNIGLPYLESIKREGKILSVGCSTGEEAYSVAIANLQKGYGNFRVDGIDVSERRIGKAQKGEYGILESGLGLDGKLTQGFFNPKFLLEVEVKPEVRRHVNFFAHDILNAPTEEQYDVVFCLHLFDHLSEKGRTVALENILGSMAGESYLIFHTLVPGFTVPSQMFQLEQKRYFDGLKVKGLERLATPNKAVAFKYHK